MADPKKVRWSQLKVGIVGIAAFVILAVLLRVLPPWGDEGRLARNKA